MSEYKDSKIEIYSPNKRWIQAEWDWLWMFGIKKIVINLTGIYFYHNFPILRRWRESNDEITPMLETSYIAEWGEEHHVFIGGKEEGLKDLWEDWNEQKEIFLRITDTDEKVSENGTTP
jgi:hypothetical protein